MENKKINWAKMDVHGYDGKSVYCGTEDAESVANWQLAKEELAKEEHRSACEGKDTKRLSYLQKKIDDKLNYRMN
ncbi:MAG: hypothetical protein RR540_09175 [Oscillospiraceae bacterium]